MHTDVTIIDVIWPPIWVLNGTDVPCASAMFVGFLCCDCPVLNTPVPTVLLGLV
jgi:hypothetical protein